MMDLLTERQQALITAVVTGDKGAMGASFGVEERTVG
jgi:hypothetical protein